MRVLDLVKENKDLLVNKGSYHLWQFNNLLNKSTGDIWKEDLEMFEDKYIKMKEKELTEIDKEIEEGRSTYKGGHLQNFYNFLDRRSTDSDNNTEAQKEQLIIEGVESIDKNDFYNQLKMESIDCLNNDDMDDQELIKKRPFLSGQHNFNTKVNAMVVREETNLELNQHLKKIKGNIKIENLVKLRNDVSISEEVKIIKSSSINVESSPICENKHKLNHQESFQTSNREYISN